MENRLHTDNPNDLVLGTIEHYKYVISEYERAKNLAENAVGDLANELFMELDGIVMVMEEYLLWQ